MEQNSQERSQRGGLRSCAQTWVLAPGSGSTTFAGTAGSPTRRGKATFPEQSFVRGVGAFLAPGATGETLTHQEQTPAFKILIKQPESLKQRIHSLEDTFALLIP